MFETKPGTLDQVIRILRAYANERGMTLPGDAIDPRARFTDFGLDSLDEVTIVDELERHFNISLDRDAIDQARTIGDLVGLIDAVLDTLPRRC